MTDKVILITGGSSGIGRGTVDVMLEKGARVAVASLTDPGDLPKEVLLLPCDVSDCAQVNRAVEATVARWGRLDGLFANAGMVIYQPFLEMADETWHRTMAVNLHGVFYSCRAAARVMARQKKGSIVVTSSVRAVATTPLVTAYSATKGALDSFVTALATELGPLGIRINSIQAGAIDSAMLRDSAMRFTDNDMGKLEASLVPMIPLQRIGLPREIGEAVAFLFSEAASYINGAHLPVDGGMLCRLA
ncbi:SDR family oxidoreductase [soil metagenome]